MAFWQKRDSKISVKSNVRKSELLLGDLPVEVQRKEMRSMRIRISTNGEVLLSIPYHISDAEALHFLNSKAEWIRQHVDRIRQLQPETSDFSQVLFLGELYPTEIHFHPIAPRVQIGSDGQMHLYLKPGSALNDIPKVLDAFYRIELKKQIAPLIAEWEPVMGVKVESIRLKQMKTRWGTCNVVDHRIWFNVELAKKSFPCIEYIVVHEMCHLIEKGHGPRFKACMDRFLPHWRKLRLELNGKKTVY
jgi:predicted metal-dependent hydrolase